MHDRTPEQVATEVLKSLPDSPADWNFHALIAETIRGDRETRETAISDALGDALEETVIRAVELNDPELRCGKCDDLLCSIEPGDTIRVLASVTLSHRCWVGPTKE